MSGGGVYSTCPTVAPKMARQADGWMRYLTLLIVLLLAQQGTALRCWSCMSDMVAECGEPFESEGVAGPSACDGPPPPDLIGSAIRPVCYKATVQVNEVEKYVYRACDWARGNAGSAEFCMHAPRVLPPHAQVLACRTCYTDGCNGATPGPAPVSVVLVVAAVSAWLYA